MDRVGRPEAVIDIDDGDSRSARVEHSEKRRDSLQVGPVPNGCWDGNEGGADQPTQNTG